MGLNLAGTSATGAAGAGCITEQLGQKYKINQRLAGPRAGG